MYGKIQIVNRAATILQLLQMHGVDIYGIQIRRITHLASYELASIAPPEVSLSDQGSTSGKKHYIF